MKLLGITSDAPGWTYVWEIAQEMMKVETRFALQHPELAAELTPLEPIIVEKFPDLDFDFGFCFRCLDRDSGWVSKARLYQNKDDPYSFCSINNIPQSSRAFGFDIVVYREDFEKIKKDKAAQKLLLGEEFWRFFQLTLPKYKKKLPITNDEMDKMLMVFEDWLIEHDWIIHGRWE